MEVVIVLLFDMYIYIYIYVAGSTILIFAWMKKEHKSIKIYIIAAV